MEAAPMVLDTEGVVSKGEDNLRMDQGKDSVGDRSGIGFSESAIEGKDTVTFNSDGNGSKLGPRAKSMTKVVKGKAMGELKAWK
ncbi:hypothetical protein L7F22_023012 [Adiantum nelumboides]|nr:hypothetical protein [Adiantum nelumboides]